MDEPVNAKTSPLEELLEDEAQASSRSEITLAQLLKPYTYIGKNTKSIHLRETAFELPARLTILLLFLGRLAVEKLGHRKDKSVSQSEVIDFFAPQGIPEGTIKSSLKKLRDNRLIIESSQGRYSTGFDKVARIQSEYKKHEQS